ncbi:hypothetical protein [Nocardia sp. NPDC051832]|uniref:hypothetical protein n=1 Tax=Nocardia sp. NPDC051832 TaxID=3155673 RepID=UPI003427DFF8
MAYTGLTRTDYWNRVTNTVRSGNPSRTEIVTDVENFAIPHSGMLAASLHLWGIAVGLAVTATVDQPGLTIAPGAATDNAGRLIVVATGSVAITSPDIDPSQTTDIPTAAVTDTGITLSTNGITGARYLTIRHHEVTTEGLLGNAPTLTQAPWIRLQSTTDFDDAGLDLVLAHVTLSNGNVTALTPQKRRHTGIHADRVQFHKAHSAAAPGLTVTHTLAAELSAQPNGSLTLTQTGPKPALTLDANGDLGLGTTAPAAGVHIDRGATDRLALKLESSGPGWGSGLQLANTSAEAKTFGLQSGSDGKLHVVDVGAGVDRVVVDKSGNVGIGTQRPGRILHVEGTEIHSGGAGSGFSFADRNVTTLVNNPGAGQRWIWYAVGGSARLWSGSDRLTINVAPNEIGLDVNRRMRIRAEGGPTAGTWLHQDGADRSFIGLADLDKVGFWGSGFGWGLTMRTTNGDVDIAGFLDTKRRMRVRQGTDDPSAGIWFYQRGPQADRGFVGMASDTEIGFFGTGIGWALKMNTNSGSVDINGGNAAFGAALRCKGNTGVWATGTASGIIASGPIAGSFFGDVRISGELSKGGGGFKIDHPLDPEHKYLSHSFVESPERLNLYRGTVGTDEHGYAEVRLPGYFDALNEEFTYQLTPLGEPASVAIATEVADNRFTICSDKPFVRVSWQVTGVRKDPWANAHRIRVEEAKPEHEQRYFLHPTEYGASPTRGMRNLETEH